MPKQQIKKYTILFIIGAFMYFECELNWRYLGGHLPVHWTMPILGGILFVLIGGINNWFTWEMSLISQMLFSSLIVTFAEFISGVILNICLKLDIWDYSNLPMNIMGQVCVPFMFLWFFLSLAAIILDDVLRWKLFNEEKPHYYIV